MSAIPNHPFELGDWSRALAGKRVDWKAIADGYVAAVDWPASAFWRELADAHPDALVLLSVRDSADAWLASMEATVLPIARMSVAPDWKDGRALVQLFERFTGTEAWDDAATLLAAYERHNEDVKRSVAPERLLEWKAADGWPPLCAALDLPVPETPFPWTNRREDWG